MQNNRKWNFNWWRTFEKRYFCKTHFPGRKLVILTETLCQMANQKSQSVTDHFSFSFKKKFPLYPTKRFFSFFKRNVNLRFNKNFTLKLFYSFLNNIFIKLTKRKSWKICFTKENFRKRVWPSQEKKYLKKGQLIELNTSFNRTLNINPDLISWNRTASPAKSRGAACFRPSTRF